MTNASAKPTKYPQVAFRAPRLPRYEEALRVRQLKQPDLSLADWCREACDLLAARDLGPADRAHQNRPMPKHKAVPVSSAKPATE